MPNQRKPGKRLFGSWLSADEGKRPAVLAKAEKCSKAQILKAPLRLYANRVFESAGFSVPLSQPPSLGWQAVSRTPDGGSSESSPPAQEPISGSHTTSSRQLADRA